MAIISSNSPGSFTFKSLNNNIVSVTGNTISINGVGTGEIEVTQAATSNFNEITGILKVFVEKAKVVILDTDGDGVSDLDDFIIDDSRIFSRSQFTFDTDSWGTVMYKKKSNGQLDEFYGNVGSGYITPELDASPIGYSTELTWKTRTDANWITLTRSLGGVVELERGADGIKNINTKGNKATFNVAENNTGSSREGNIFVDYYYQGKFITTAKEKIKQIATKLLFSLSDNTPLPQTPDSVIDTNQLVNSGNKNTSPTRFDITLSSSTGIVKFYRNAYQTADRFVVIIDNEIKLDTGNVTGALTHELNKTTSSTEAQVIIYSDDPTNSGWQFELSDVGKNVELIGATSINVKEAIANQTASPGSYAFELISGWVQKPNVSFGQNVFAYPRISSRFGPGVGRFNVPNYLDVSMSGYAWDLRSNGYYPQKPSYFKKTLKVVNEFQVGYSSLNFYKAGYTVRMTGSQTIQIKFYVNSGLTKFSASNSDFTIVDENNTSLNTSEITVDASDGFEKITTLTITSPNVGVNGTTVLFIKPQEWLIDDPIRGRRTDSGFGEIYFTRTPINTSRDFVGVPITGLNSYS